MEQWAFPQADYRESVARFMAHVHSQVNVVSRTYLHNEKRFNYTTPKSFLEQISLYSKLLRLKFSELSKKIERLENGLDKLKKTAAQVGHWNSNDAGQKILDKFC